MGCLNAAVWMAVNYISRNQLTRPLYWRNNVWSWSWKHAWSSTNAEDKFQKERQIHCQKFILNFKRSSFISTKRRIVAVLLLGCFYFLQRNILGNFGIRIVWVQKCRMGLDYIANTFNYLWGILILPTLVSHENKAQLWV